MHASRDVWREALGWSPTSVFKGPLVPVWTGTAAQAQGPAAEFPGSCLGLGVAPEGAGRKV